MKLSKLASVAVILCAAVVLHAQATRTWVSGVGDDANPCSRTAPCKTFAGAISKTSAGGEIDALDPGGFGALTITKAITIDGGAGQVASVLVAGTNGIVVAAGAGDVVTIRNLSIDGLGPGSTAGINGIRFLSGRVLHIENVAIFGFSNNGIDIATSSAAKVFVDRTMSRDNGNNGIGSTGTGGTVFATIDDCTFEDNSDNGVFASDFSRFLVRNTHASGNGNTGFVALANADMAVLNIINSDASNNGVYGVLAGGGGAFSLIHLGGVSLFTNFASGGSNTGIAIGSNGVVVSYGNNYNGGGGTPSSSAARQ